MSEQTSMIGENFITLLTIKLHFLVKPIDVIVQIVFSSKQLFAMLTLPSGSNNFYCFSIFKILKKIIYEISESE